MTLRTLLAGAATAALLLSGCVRENAVRKDADASGGVRIALSQDPLRVHTKADDGGTLPPVDSFEVEIYNAKALRLYRKAYADAKDETILLNAGDFRLVAHHGDSLGAGFDKAYYLAEEPFTVHGFVDNGGEPDEVSAVAKLANVKIAVNYGDNLNLYYSDFYTVVRHASYSKKHVRFAKGETRYGYMPGGDLYLEVYAQLSGSGIQDGGVKDSLVYFKTEPVTYDPNDFVTFNIETGVRVGDLTVNILIDNTVETVDESFQVPASALPDDAPVFSVGGETLPSYTYFYPAGIGARVTDAVLSFSTASGAASIVVETDSDCLDIPSPVDLLSLSAEEKTALDAAGIRAFTSDATLLGFVDFSGAVKTVSLLGGYDPENPVTAVFTVTVTDQNGRSSTAAYSLAGERVDSRVEVMDYNVWGWKIVAPTAVFEQEVDSAAQVKLRYSADGNTWKTVNSTAINGKTVTFETVPGLTAGTSYQLQAFVDTEANAGTVATLATEDPLQVGNSGFEEYTALTHSTPYKLLLVSGTFTVTWWQLYKDDPWWAVNSPVTLRSGECTPEYQEYKTFPTVSLIQDGAYSGTSVMLASVSINDWASLIVLGSNPKPGEIFIGTANDEPEDDWAKVSEGHAFTSRPASLSFRYKFDQSGSSPYYVHAEVLSSGGILLSEATYTSATEASSWTQITVPLDYTVMNRKAGIIRLSFRSATDGTGSETVRRFRDFSSLSGDDDIHAGNVLFIDNVTLNYAE